jgi:hypothetical protein
MNPYSPPMGSATPYGSAAASEARATPTDMTMELLRQTRPWVLFLGVMAFIGSAFLLLGGVGSMVLGATSGARGAPTMLLGLIYIPMSVLYVYPGLKLWSYGQAIARLLSNRTSEDLEAALAHQKSFWKFAGIATIVVMVLYVVLIAAAMAMAVLGLSRLH